MPAPLDIDREAVKTLAIAIGPREAARRMNLPEATVLAWSARDKWFAPAVPTPLPPTMQKQPAINTIKPSDVMAEYGKNSRLHLAKAGLEAAKRFAEKTGEQVIDKAKQFGEIVRAESTLHGWEEKQQGGSGLVNVTLIRVELPEQTYNLPS